MKRLFIFSFLFLALNNINYAQWVKQETGFSNTTSINSIYFLDPNTGYMVNNVGQVAKTTNGGSSWTISYTGFNSSFYGLFFTSSTTGYMTSFNGLIIKTTDGGSSWIQQVSNTNAYLSAVYFPTENIGYVAGDGGVVLKTTNSGNNWFSVNLPISSDQRSVYFTDALNGYVAGTNCFQTTDGGITWSINSVPTSVGRTVFFPDQNNGYIAGDWGEVYKTTNKGFTWVQQSSPTSNGLYGMYFLNNQIGYIVGLKGTIIGTTNGGTNWVKLESGTNLNLFSIKFTSANIGFCIGGYPVQPILLKTTNGGFPAPVLKAVLTVDTLYYDSEFNGVISKQVTGINSIGDSLTYKWLVNDTLTYNYVSPAITLQTGTNKVKLTVTSPSGITNSDSIFTNVFASRNITGGSIYSGVSQFGSHYYVTSMDKGVYEIDSTGKTLKTFLTGGSIQSVLSISSNGRLYTGSSDTRLYAFDTSLIPLWNNNTGGLINYAPALSSDGSTVYCVTSSANILAFDVKTGSIRWGFPVNGMVTNSPVVFLDKENKNIIYAGTSSGNLYAIKDKGNSYELLWQKQLADTIFSSVAVYPDGLNSMIYLASKGGYLYRMTWDGIYDDTWKVNINNPVYSSPLIDGNGIVYIGAKNGVLFGFPKEFTNSSTPVSTITLESGIIGTPAIGSNGFIYVGTEKGFLYSLDNSKQSLQVKWKANLYSSINSSALVTESGLIYMGTLKGDLFVLKEFAQDKSSQPNIIWPTFKGDNLRSKVVGVNFTTGIKDNLEGASTYQLLQNYPNPFNPSTKIRFSVGPNYNGLVQIKVYDILGKELVTLLNESRSPGTYEIDFDAAKYNLSSGMYFYTIKSGGFNQVRKMILIK